MVGGVRRSALISLSDLNDREMRFAKSGQWWEQNVQRALANNSVNYKEKPDVGTFMREWLSLYDSKSGERGIYNSMSAKRTVERLNGRYRDGSGDYIRRRPERHEGAKSRDHSSVTVPNLSEVVIRRNDTRESLKRVKHSTILGHFNPLTDSNTSQRVEKKL